MNENIYTSLEQALLGNPKYVAEDGKILKAIVYSDVMTMNPELLEILLDSPEITEHFFTNVNGTLVFDKQQFAWLLESKEFLPDSYTRYTNKIGLSYRGEFLSKSNDVVLDFPYKDSLLVGGQDHDDQGRDEIFFHDVIASEEITRLLAPKTLSNARKYIQGGGGIPCAKFSDTDNLIVKGNNLIALASLLERFEGQVKCIYIDPPYNTGKDSFNYNDRFNHSTWLTFMKNRLELAKRLLREDGIIFIQCDDNEYGYLKVLCDEIFNRANFVASLVWKGRGGRSDSKYIAQMHETILCYAKNKEVTKVYKRKVVNSDKYNFSDSKGEYKRQLIRKWGSNSRREDRPNLYYPVNFEGQQVLPILPNGKDGCWRWSAAKLEQAIADGLVEAETRKDGVIELYEKIYKTSEIKEIVRNSWIEETYSGNGKAHLDELFGESPFDYAKPEGLIADFIDMSTDVGELVLDFFAGSGTTAAVAHKMGRRYIGIEQMDYIEDITVARLQKVLDGEQGGISQEVGWTGGGSFVYCELLENSAQLIRKIQQATVNTIYKVKEEIYSDYRIVPYLTKEELKAADQEFLAFRSEGEEGLSKQKELLIRIVDKNKLYVNYSDIRDEDYDIDDADLAFSSSFYSKREGDE